MSLQAASLFWQNNTLVMYRTLFIIFLLLSADVNAQHCPWDCSGMILLKTDLSKTEFTRLNPVLVDGNRKEIVDTVYGTGLATYDTGRFMHYDDFMQYRTGRIKLHYWYAFDTLYYFAKDNYLVRYNYCRYQYQGNTDLFIRFTDTAGNQYGYIEIPVSRRIHLHDFGPEIRKRLPLAEAGSMHALIMDVKRNEWKLPER